MPRGTQDGHLFLKPAAPPAYLDCAKAPNCTTIEYKSGTRKHISSQGYKIGADFGTQYSDLLGGNAGHQVKIPTPRTTSLTARSSGAAPSRGRPHATTACPAAVVPGEIYVKVAARST